MPLVVLSVTKSVGVNAGFRYPSNLSLMVSITLVSRPEVASANSAAPSAS